MRTPVAAVISAFLLFPLSADEEVSEDSLFSGDDMVEEVEITDGEEPPENELLVSETVKWGGGFESELDAEWTWRDGGETGLPPDSSSLDIALGADVFLDARPDEDFRVFGKLEASYPFAFDGGGSEADIRVVELFSDFHLGNRLFFRVGKHAVHWGSGYFFSPADVFNLIPIDPDLLAEREQGFRAEGTKGWDRWLAAFSAGAFPLTSWIIAGLDLRFGWSTGLPGIAHTAGVIGVAAGLALFLWAMASNAFFAEGVRIQSERGHTVATGGPYRAVRHPGYAGAILAQAATPLLLGSPWALIPTAGSVIGYIVRTALEDKTLLAELPGYAEFAETTRHRLVPGLW